MTDIVEISQGLSKFLVYRLSGIIAAMNSDLAAKVVAAGDPPAFTVKIGDQLNPTSPVLCVAWNSETPDRACNDQEAIWAEYQILCLIPSSGDDTPMNFEMCMQVSQDHVRTLFLQDDLMLLPVIDIGGGEFAEAEEAYRSRMVKIWPRVNADGKTYTRGWMTTYTAKFNIVTR